mmetsp:Transcript_4/g.9  ORF Transcript_4/g.9 Transcript_4/m.9 type:complete len:219 (-) Transcript_4:121-777(-)
MTRCKRHTNLLIWAIIITPRWTPNLTSLLGIIPIKSTIILIKFVRINHRSRSSWSFRRRRWSRCYCHHSCITGCICKANFTIWTIIHIPRRTMCTAFGTGILKPPPTKVMICFVHRWFTQINIPPRRRCTHTTCTQIFTRYDIVMFRKLFPVATSSITFSKCPTFMSRHDTFGCLTRGAILTLWTGGGGFCPRGSTEHVASVGGARSAGIKCIFEFVL